MEPGDPVVDKTLFRQVAGSFASGVTIITTGKEGECRGFTASSFTSLSLEPPLVLVCVHRESNTLPVIQHTGAFAINILSQSQEHASRLFSSRIVPDSERMQQVCFHGGTSGVPILDDAIAFFECRTLREYDGGDHVIFVGHVIDAGVSNQGEPLLYYRGRYHALTEALEPG
jgi:3-hydroxy-9,10-secoandrosta-1,3,5(10)-triene-9,17-dione monooxygenase reductase component